MDLTATVYHDELIAKCKLGDRLSYKVLYEQYAKAMYNTSLRIVNNKADAEDVLQDSFSSVFQYLEGFDYSSTFGAWIKRIVINKSVDLLRRRKLNIVEIDEVMIYGIQEEEPGSEEQERWKVEEIKKAMGSLPNGYRTVLSLFLFEGYDQDEIAEILGITSSTVRTQYHRGKKKLFNLLQGGGEHDR